MAQLEVGIVRRHMQHGKLFEKSFPHLCHREALSVTHIKLIASFNMAEIWPRLSVCSGFDRVFFIETETIV